MLNDVEQQLPELDNPSSQPIPRQPSQSKTVSYLERGVDSCKSILFNCLKEGRL
jgi:hypothetical protein